MSETNPQIRRRSERIMLQIMVFARLEMSGGKPVEVQAFTQIVNAHGGRLELPLRLLANQKITLVNPQTRNAVGCRVVSVEKESAASYQTSFEFEQPNPHFWPISLPPEDWELGRA